MSGRTLAVLGSLFLLTLGSFAGQEAKPACCQLKQKGQQGETVKAEKLKCSLTGKIVDKCCCVERAGKTHCTLADKDVASCCCTPVKASEKDVR